MGEYGDLEKVNLELSKFGVCITWTMKFVNASDNPVKIGMVGKHSCRCPYPQLPLIKQNFLNVVNA